MKQKYSSTYKIYQYYYIARQPIFTSSGICWGWELLFRNAEDLSKAIFTSETGATSQVIVDGLVQICSDLKPNSKLLINFPAEMIDRYFSMIIPKNQCILEILETVRPTVNVLNEIQAIKSLGYLLALDDYVGDEFHRDFLKLVDIVKVDFKELSTNEQKISVYTAAKKINNSLLLLAEKVEDNEEYKFAKKCGYDLFQGFFFQKPELIKGRKVPLHTKSRVSFLQILSSRDLTKQELEKILQHDTALSYRLLKYVNSAVFPQHKPIQNIPQAILYLGIIPLQKWILCCVLADSCNNEIKSEVAFLGSVRGYFFQWIASKNKKLNASDAFSLGLFSTLEALYEFPFHVLFDAVPLQDDIINALSFNSGPLVDWMLMIKAIESDDMLVAFELLKKLNVDDPCQAVRKYQEIYLARRSDFYSYAM